MLAAGSFALERVDAIYMNKPELSKPKLLRVALLEDQRVLARLIEHCLRDWFKKIELVKFENGDEAWQELSQTQPDLLILDWKHPGLTGGEIVQKLALLPATFPLVLTSDLFEEHVQQFSEQGLVFRFLPKPFHILEFWAVLNDLVGPSDYPEMQVLVETRVVA